MNNNTTYQPLDKYIRQVNVRNTDARVMKLVGLTIDKKFIPSVANIIGTDLTNYSVIKNEQFACSLMQVSRDKKMPVAMYAGEDAIISPAYPIFEVIDKSALLPQYLMMWFSRAEFDREASYYAIGGVRGSLTWEDFTDMRLPVPSIAEQQAIVDEYETIARRIRTNEQLISKLEETAQTLYRHMFVDNIDKENLPQGWRMGTLGEIAECFDYRRKPLSQEQRASMLGDYPYYGAISLVDKVNQYLFDGTYILFSEDGVNIVDANGHPAIQYVWGKFWVNNHAHVLQGNENVSTEYLLLALRNTDVRELVTGAAQPKINQENMNSISLIIPTKSEMQAFTENITSLYNHYKVLYEEIYKLTELQSLLLAKMGL